jgi:hypothetical protein
MNDINEIFGTIEFNKRVDLFNSRIITEIEEKDYR